MTPHDEITREIAKIINQECVKGTHWEPCEYCAKGIAKALTTWLLECVPEDKERFVRPGHKSNSRFNARVEGWNAFRAELLRRMSGK